MQVLLGLKASPAAEQMEERLQYRPDVFEFYTTEADMTPQGLKRLEEAVVRVQEVTRRIVIHQPMRYHKVNYTELIAPEDYMPGLYRFIEETTENLLRITFDHDVQLLVHGSYSRQVPEFLAQYRSLAAAREVAMNRIDRFARMGQKHIMFENSISPIFFYGDPQMDRRIMTHHWRLAFDTSHCFIHEHGSNGRLAASLKRLAPQVVHYHLVDSMGIQHDSLPLGKGRIDWQRVMPLLNSQASYIYEIAMDDPNDSRPQRESAAYLRRLFNLV